MSTFAAWGGRIFTQLSHWRRLFLVLAALPLAFAQTSGGGKLTRLYVESFTTKSGGQQLRDRVISELRKHSSLQVVTTAAGADATLDGGGEIWVKGYQSLNPRSGRLPSDGTPVYDGYLSVELKDAQGQTFWSYLVTPGVGAEDVSRDLARRIAKRVADAMEQGEPMHHAVISSAPATVLKGAGATFPAPVYEKWFKNYRLENPNLEITYSSVGSEAGIRQLLAGQVDFGASDNPEAIREIAPAEQSRFLLFPSVVGAVVPIVNLPGTSGDIALTAEALSGIYLGKITKWNDPVLRKANRGIRLPDLDIVVVHRSDGSGTSYAFTDYLSKTSAEWKAQVGASLTPKWPTGKGATGNDGVAKLVKELGGSIGYVEFIYALENHMSFSRVRNQNGEFVDASLESMALAANDAVKMSDDFKVSIVDAPGAGAYPIASFTWLVVPARIADSAKHQAMQSFLEWMLGPGQTQAAALGYLALPRELVVREQEAVQKIQVTASGQ
jgi:phosphate transport system substrate-binding protein